MSVHGYIRVSTAEQGRSGLGLAAQRDAIETHAAAKGWGRVLVHEEVASGSNAERPVLRGILDAMRRSDVLMVARLDRLTRSLLDFATIVKQAQAGRWSLVVLDQGFDLGTASGRAMAGMLAVFAEYERELIAQRTSDALRALPRERRNGQPVYSEGVRARARELRGLGHSMRSIANILASEGVTTPRGGTKLHCSTVSRLLEDVAES